MPIPIEPVLLTLHDWTFRLRMDSKKPKRLLVLLHGWMGDENSMWILAHGLLTRYTILAPRALFPVPQGGYSWRPIRPGTWGMAEMDDLVPAAHSFIEFVDLWLSSIGLVAQEFDLMGFSQGAALGYMITFLYPERIRRLVALSGFIPLESDRIIIDNRMEGKKILVAHGRKDELIPIEKARQAVDILRGAGAHVTYCESDAAHKVSKECRKAMEDFLCRD